MRESITYQQILNEGRVEGIERGRTGGELREARRMVLRAGFRRLGVLTATDELRIQRIDSLTILESLLDRLFDVETWDELLRDIP